MNRRNFLQEASVLSGAFAFPARKSSAAHELTSAKWRSFEVTTHIEVLKLAGITRLWAPAALVRQTPFQKTIGNTFHCNAGVARTIRNSAEPLEVIAAEFPPGVRPILTLTGQVRTRNWTVDLVAPGKPRNANRSELDKCLQPTRLLPTGGIVKQRATEITKSAKTDLGKARAIYDWIVENTYRNPKTRGCGVGDIRFMLESGDLGGKCADLNALYVGLARAAGLPARDVYGIRIASSRMG
jgi:transglutaminase-like putative cysteine protease